jgi:hypothetical protein
MNGGGGLSPPPPSAFSRHRLGVQGEEAGRGEVRELLEGSEWQGSVGGVPEKGS